MTFSNEKVSQYLLSRPLDRRKERENEVFHVSTDLITETVNGGDIRNPTKNKIKLLKLTSMIVRAFFDYYAMRRTMFEHVFPFELNLEQ